MAESKSVLPGLALAAAIALPALALGAWLPLIGGPVWSILLGMLIALWRTPPAACTAGIRFSGKKVLQYAIILLGFEMNLFQVFAVGSQSLTIIAVTLTAAFITAWLAGNYLRLEEKPRILIGVGTAICGGSAIAAAAPAINADEQDIAYSIATIFLFNIAAVFIFPFLGHALGLSDSGFGMWAGTAINDTSSVVAAAYSYSSAAGNYATIVKLTRSLMIVPVTLALAVGFAASAKSRGQVRLGSIIPWFIFSFLLASVINTSDILPPLVCDWLAKAGKFLIIVAMAAIGLNTNLPKLLNNGLRPIALGLLCWLAVAASSLLAQRQLGLW